jgi:phosphoesterase RecJ-like protein
MNAVTPAALGAILATLQAADSVAVVGHERPDGDCVAAQLALAEFLAGCGKRVGVYSAGPFDRAEVRAFAARFRSTIEPEMRARQPLVVVVDCSTPDRTGTLEPEIDGLRTLVIDHHSAGVAFGDLRLVDPSAPATVYLVQLIIEASGTELTPALAELLLFGLCTDTGFFRHLNTHSQPVFAAAGRLVAAGADPQTVYQRIGGGRTFLHRRLLGTLLARTEQHRGGRLLFTCQWRSERERAGYDELYDLLLTVAGCEVLVFAREEPAGGCSVSMRSSAAADVGSVAHALGGGGHRQAAGFTWPGSIDELRAEILRRLG